MEWISVIVFLVMLWGFGYSITYKRTWGDTYERLFMRIGIGLAVLTTLSAVFTILRIPLWWWLFVVLSIIIPLWQLKSGWKFKFEKISLRQAVVLLAFCFVFVMYLKGSFAYALYEDGDPWKHAGIVKYIDQEKTALEPFSEHDVFQYVDSYPPGYDVLLSIPYGINDNLIWTMKFFNALLVSLGIFFFYYLVKKLSGSDDIATLSTIFFAFFPSYLSHFIWAHSLVITLMLPFLYVLLQGWLLEGIILYSAILLAQPTQAVKISFIAGIYLLTRSIMDKRWNWKVFNILLIGGILAITIWWGPMLIKYGSPENLILATGTSISGPTKNAEGFTLKFHGTADRKYTLEDFVLVGTPKGDSFSERFIEGLKYAPNMINNPTGVGIVLLALIILGIGFYIKFREGYVLFIILWLIFAFLGIHGERLPVQLWAFRFWSLFAVFGAMLAGYAGVKIISSGKKWGIPALLILLVLVGGVWFTSGQQKWDVNTGNWEFTAGEFVQYGNLDSWKWLAQKDDAKVFYPCRNDNNVDVALLGIDQYTCVNCLEEKEFKLAWTTHSITEMESFAKARGYEYLFIDAICSQDFKIVAGVDDDGALLMLNEYLSNSSLPLVHQSDGGLVWALS